MSIGVLVVILAATVTVPIVVDAATESGDWQSFATVTAITAYVGGMLALSSRGHGGWLDRRTGYLLTV